MNTNESTRPDAVTQARVLKRCWRAFNRWRERYFLVRLLYLFLMAAVVCHLAFRQTIVKLVRYALQAIEAGSDPSLVTALARHKRIRLAHHFQLTLRRLADGDEDGSLSQEEMNRAREFGLDPEELAKKSVEADLSQLMEACHHAGLLPISYTAAIARREARLAAVAQVEEMKRPARAEIEAMLRTWTKPDYSQLDTWARGGWRFLRQLDLPFRTLGWTGPVVVWLIFCFSATLMVISFVRTGKTAKSLLMGGALPLPLILYAVFQTLRRAPFWNPLSFICSAIGFVCVSMAAAAFAAKMAERSSNRRLLFSIAALVLGVSLLVWALPRLLSGKAFGPGYIQTVYADGLVSLFQIPAGLLFFITLPMWVKDAAIVIGTVCFIAGLVGFARFPLSGAERKESAPAGVQGKEESTTARESPYQESDS